MPICLCSSFEVDGIDLSDLLRDSLKMPDLYAFDGNNKHDMVNRIEVNYHRITKIKPKVPILEHAEYAVWDYTGKVTPREMVAIEKALSVSLAM